MLFGSTEAEPESRFRLALKRLIGATSEEEVKETIMDLEEALRLILEKRDKEWTVLLQEKGAGAPAYAPNLKGFAEDMAREAAAAVEAKIDARIATARGMPSGAAVPADIQDRLKQAEQNVSNVQEQLEHLRETVKGELAPDVRDALKKEVRASITNHMSGDDELSRMIAALVKELRDQLTSELKAELTTEVKEAIKDEIKSELRKELL
ncbi:MAG: hypothetical protein HY366_03070 [Candidatus Aenigmarchaeota archaeon]|nr:hypothetical protein [Candidatus Aenigmarchaeota archaeon]